MVFLGGGGWMLCISALILPFGVHGDAFVGLAGRSCEVCYGRRWGRRSRVCP